MKSAFLPLLVVISQTVTSSDAFGIFNFGIIKSTTNTREPPIPEPPRKLEGPVEDAFGIIKSTTNTRTSTENPTPSNSPFQEEDPDSEKQGLQLKVPEKYFEAPAQEPKAAPVKKGRKTAKPAKKKVAAKEPVPQDPTPSTDDLLSPNYEIEKIPVRIGHGFDIHRMAPFHDAGQPVVIGGVTIPHGPQKWIDAEGKYTEKGGVYETELGVVAHSDGDVIYHSIVDAIFGALTLPDIGQVFQDSDPRWKGCDSSKFMEHAKNVMDGYGYQIGNCDVTLILERPKVAEFKPAMKENIVRLLGTTEGRVNIKARTHERVDSVGELRSLSCHVVLTLELKK